MPALPQACRLACRRAGQRLTRFVLVADVLRQQMTLWEAERAGGTPPPGLGGLPASPLFAHVRASNRKSQLANRKSRLTFNPVPLDSLSSPAYVRRAAYVISTSRFGIGQIAGSNCTPLGLHRVAVKAGGGWPIGTAFRDRRAVGITWRGLPDAPIAHRVLWLEGLEPGFNQGGEVDSFARYIYIHGVGDETRLGRPASHGCIHLAARDLIPLHDRLPAGALVWITAH